MIPNNFKKSSRIRQVNNVAEPNSKGAYVLYWMQLYRRLDYNHALNFAIDAAKELNKPLVVYEGLKLHYPWASDRLHTFILQGMQLIQRVAKGLGINYWPFVETLDGSGRGLLKKLSKQASLVVTDDFPAFIIPGHTAALAKQTGTPVVSIDGNGLIPLSEYGEPASAAAHLRHRVHKNFAGAWKQRAGRRSRITKPLRSVIDPPFEIWEANAVEELVAELPLDHTVPPVESLRGGLEAARAKLEEFVRHKLDRYAEHRSQPNPPDRCPASGLSPYLHFGHIAVEEIVERVFESCDWSLDELTPKASGKREGFYCDDKNVNAFLDELITWRDVGFLWHRHHRDKISSLEKSLPDWAWATLKQHAGDQREYVYSPEQWENAETHDELWNAAQRELVATGTIHNYMRMLWGKKVIEWSKTPADAYKVLEHLNNKYAIDGRDPNSYSGILWCFGLFDRPWPEREIFGKVRYMSSENTAKKFDLTDYLDYIRGLPSIEEVRNKK